MMLNPFQWKNGKAMTPEEVDRQRALAGAALARAGDTSPVGHWTQGAARVIDTLGGVLRDKRAGKAESAGMASADAYMQNNPVLSALLGGGGAVMGGTGMGGGGTYAPTQAPASPGSGLNMGTTETPEQQAAREANSQGSWNGGAVSDMQPNMMSTFGNASPVGGKSGYSMGADVPTTPDAVFRSTLLSEGLPEHVVDGIMMNAHDESGFNPTAVGDNGNAFGMLQWNGPRMRALKDWSAANGLDPADARTQAKFTAYELQGPEAGAGRALLATSTPGEAGAVFVNQYERPAESHRARREAAYLGGEGATSGYTGGGMSSGGMPIPMGGGGANVTAALAAAMSDPWVAKKYGPVIQALMGQEMKRNDMQYEAQLRQSDPMYQAQLAAAQAALQPTAQKPIEVGGVLLDPTTFQPIFDSRTPDPGFTMVPPNEAAAMGLPPGAYQRGSDGKITQVGGNGTNINVNTGGGPELGKLSPDYGYVLGPDGKPIIDPVTGLPKAAPVPGSPADLALKQAADKADKAGGNAEIAGDTVLTAATRARAAASDRQVGGLFGKVAALNPASNNAEVYRQVDVLKANAKVENLTAMRAASPTGGALGSVTEGEANMLAAKSGALDPASPNFERDLADYTLTMLKIIHGPEAGQKIFDENWNATPDPTGQTATGNNGLPPGFVED